MASSKIIVAAPRAVADSPSRLATMCTCVKFSEKQFFETVSRSGASSAFRRCAWCSDRALRVAHTCPA